MTDPTVEAVARAIEQCDWQDPKVMARAAIAAMPSRNEVRAAALEEAAKVADARRDRWRAERLLHVQRDDPAGMSAWVRFGTKSVEAVEIAAAIRAIAADDGRPLPDDGWRDIATAPTDGSTVLARQGSPSPLPRRRR